MPRELVFFPEEAIQLQLEIARHHPILSADLAKMGDACLEEKVAMIALYCGVGVDGWFNENDLQGLFRLLLEKLRKRSTIVI